MEMLLLAVTVIFRPVEAFKMIKLNRKRFNYMAPIILITAIFLGRVFYVYNTHFPLVDIDPWDTGVLIEFVKVIVPLLTWIFACYAVTSILGGESMFKEVTMSAVLCMIPYIIMTVFLTIFSKVLCGTEQSLFLLLQMIMWLWVGCLAFLSVKSMNGYSILQTCGIVFVILMAMFLIWAIAVLIYALFNQFILFIYGLFQEIRINFS